MSKKNQFQFPVYGKFHNSTPIYVPTIKNGYTYKIIDFKSRIFIFRLFGANRDMNLDFYLRDIAFFDGACYSCSTHCLNGDMNCTEDFDLLIGMVK